MFWITITRPSRPKRGLVKKPRKGKPTRARGVKKVKTATIVR